MDLEGLVGGLHSLTEKVESGNEVHYILKIASQSVGWVQWHVGRVGSLIARPEFN